MKKDWETKTLGDFFDITSSKRVFKSDWTSVGVPFYRAREIVSLSKNKPLKDPIFISTKMYEEYASKYGKPEEGDILVTGVGTLGICYVVKKNDKFYFKDGNIIWLKNTSNVNTKFIEYFFKSKELIDQINSAPAGATVGTFTIIRAKNTTILIPSESEQKRIVKILDEKFETIEELKKITKEQLTSAKELFESKLKRVFEDPTYSQIYLADVCKVERGSSPRPIVNYITDDDQGINWIKIGDTKNINRYLYKTRQKITREGAKQSRYVNENDLILSNSMSFGKPYIMKTSGCIHDGWFVLRPNIDLDTEFFYYSISSRNVQDQMSKLATGAVVKNISGDLVKKVLLALPDLKEQKQVVKELDELSKKTKELETIFRRKITDLEELKKSYLHEAFSGNL